MSQAERAAAEARDAEERRVREERQAELARLEAKAREEERQAAQLLAQQVCVGGCGGCCILD